MGLEKRKPLFSLLWIAQCYLGCPAHSLITTLTNPDHWQTTIATQKQLSREESGRGVALTTHPIWRHGTSNCTLRGDFYLHLYLEGKVKLSSCLTNTTPWKHTKEMRQQCHTVLFVILILDGGQWWIHAPSALTPQKGTR